MVKLELMAEKEEKEEEEEQLQQHTVPSRKRKHHESSPSPPPPPHLLEKARRPAVQLSDSQLAVVRDVEAGENVFVTGAAGTGKSHVLRHLIESVLPRGETYVCAPTGCAAALVGGTTLHSFAGIGLGRGSLSDIVDKIRRGGGRDAVSRWTKARVLVVDEISMVSARLLELLEGVARCVRRRHDRVFGGLQLVLFGDFYQLAPVPDVEKRAGAAAKAPAAVADYCFQSPVWGRLALKNHLLGHSYRQSDDATFLRVLGETRTGSLSAESVEDLLARQVAVTAATTKLYGNNRSVNQENETRLAELPGPEVAFKAVDEGDDAVLRAMVDAWPVQETVVLKKGAPVLLLRNVDTEGKLVNGSRGEVVSWNEGNGSVVVSFPDSHYPRPVTVTRQKWEIFSGSSVIASRTQVPFRLAWALTIHKCQGMELSSMVLHADTAWLPGQVYTALSRCKRLDQVSLHNFRGDLVKSDPRVTRFYQELKCSKDDDGNKKSNNNNNNNNNSNSEE